MIVLLCVAVGRRDGVVRGVTLLHNVVYIVCLGSSSIIRFDAVTHRRLADITAAGCVWRVSSDGEDVKRLLPKSPSDTIRPYTLSVTSSRLLVTSRDTNQLRQFDTVGDERSRVDLPRDMDPRHAVESLTGTFIVSHYNTQLKQCQVSEVDTGGQVLRQFSGSHLLPLGYTPHVAVDSQGNIFVADEYRGCLLLLDSQLALRRVIIDKHQLNYKKPQRLCYSEQLGQLLVVLGGRGVVVFDVIRR